MNNHHDRDLNRAAGRERHLDTWQIFIPLGVVITWTAYLIQPYLF